MKHITCFSSGSFHQLVRIEIKKMHIAIRYKSLAANIILIFTIYRCIKCIYIYLYTGEELKNIQFILLPGNRTSVVGLDVVFKCKAGYQNGSSVPVIWSKYGIENLPSR